MVRGPFKFKSRLSRNHPRIKSRVCGRVDVLGLVTIRVSSCKVVPLVGISRPNIEVFFLLGLGVDMASPGTRIVTDLKQWLPVGPNNKVYWLVGEEDPAEPFLDMTPVDFEWLSAAIETYFAEKEV